jgi:predicted Na+-dependent transporter
VGHFFKKQWFLIGIAIASLLAYFFPEWGDSLKRYGIFGIGIFLAFFITGLCLETRNIISQIQDVRAPAAAVFSSLLLYPLLAWLMALPVLPHEFVVGVCVIAVGPVTVSSGTIMTAIARGNIPLSLCICILTSFLAIFTIPVMLNLLLSVGGRIELPVLNMLGGLVLKVLLPIILGQITRPFFKKQLQRINYPLSVFQSCIIILIIFRAISSSAENITEAGSVIIGIIVFMFFMHFFMLFLNYGIANLLKLDRPSVSAFTIHTSQKTLAVTYIVWAGYFANDYPMAFIPAIICQLIQMTVGTFVAEFFRKRDILYQK